MSAENNLTLTNQHHPVTDHRSAEATASATTARPILEIDGVSKHFGDECAVEALSLTVYEGELLTLLGPSGCGKTTTLRLIAGLERPTTGNIHIGDTHVAAGNDGAFVPPERRDVGVVFQDFALFPHMTAAENVAFGISDWPREKRERRVDDLLELVGLGDQHDSTPEELSGGQKQRVALARSLAPEPEILLLDEPFSNLDIDLRVEMREEVRRILNETGVTAISVTHDQEEALSISDRVAVMSDGQLKQVDTPESIFQHPKSRFVAGFLGHASFVPARVEGDIVRTRLGPVGRDRIHGLALEYDQTDIDVLVRPDDLIARPASEQEADGRVTYRRYLGPTILYRVELETGEIVETMHNHSNQIDLNEPVSVELAASHDLAWFPVDQR